MPTNPNANDPVLMDLLINNPIAYVTILPTSDPDKLQLAISAETFALETFQAFPAKNIAGIQILFPERGNGLLIPTVILEYIMNTIRLTQTKETLN